MVELDCFGRAGATEDEKTIACFCSVHIWIPLQKFVVWAVQRYLCCSTCQTQTKLLHPISRSTHFHTWFHIIPRDKAQQLIVVLNNNFASNCPPPCMNLCYQVESFKPNCKIRFTEFVVYIQHGDVNSRQSQGIAWSMRIAFISTLYQ